MLGLLVALSTWCGSADAHWTAQVVRAAGLSSAGCTGSALVVPLSGGGDLYVWAVTGPRRVVEPNMSTYVVAGVRVRVNRFRATWCAGRRVVWIQAGPTTRRLRPPANWGRLVRAAR